MQTTALDRAAPAPIADVKTEVIDGELLLFHPQKATAIYLNPTAAVIWGLCDGHRSATEMATIIAEHFPDAPANIFEEVCATLYKLRTSGLLADPAVSHPA